MAAFPKNTARTVPTMAMVYGRDIQVSDDDLVRMSQTSPGWRFERTDEGVLVVSPTSTEGGSKSGEAFAQLYAYAKRVGGKAYDAATGFKTPGGGIVSPDASWLSAEHVARHEGQRGFWSTIPDVVIDVASITDDWQRIVAKIDQFIKDGATYAIAIDPQSKATYEGGQCPKDLRLDVAAIVDA